MAAQRLLAIDPSLTCSGWALFAVPRERLLAVGKIRGLPPIHPLAIRLRELQSKIAALLEQLELGAGDIVVCEAPTTMRDPSAAGKVEQVRGIFESVARTRSMMVPGRINPRSVHHEIMGLRGKQMSRAIVKSTALSVAAALYTSALRNLGFDTTPLNFKRNQDIVDALLLGNLALNRVNAAAIAGLALEEAFQDSRIRMGRVLAR